MRDTHACMCVCTASEPGLSAVAAEADGNRDQRASDRCTTQTGRPSAKTAPPGGGGTTEVPQRGGADYSAAAVSSVT